jgi:DmsE family decaheme c-type cytochrome
MPRTTRALVLAASVLAGWALVAAAAAPQAETGDPPAWTADDCAACHEDYVTSLAGKPHAAPPGWTVETSCGACHGDPTAHVEAAGEAPIMSFGAGTALLDRIDACGACHGDTHPRFLSSPHARAGLDCASCHTIHGELAPGAAGRVMLPLPERGSAGRIDGVSASCAECHADVAHDFELNERHRLQEGILTCTSCHDPHAPATRTVLGGFNQEACIDCHTDKGGPFVFEHGSVKVEGCVACHTPHGSVNRHLLTFQATAELCYSCHAVVPGFHVAGSPVRFGLDTNCTNCHSSIHGSNLDPFFLK